MTRDALNDIVLSLALTQVWLNEELLLVKCCKVT